MEFLLQNPDPIAALLGDWAKSVTLFSVLLRVGAALLMAAVIGLERSRKRHAAGLRTFILVAFASSVAMLLDLYLLQTTKGGIFLLSAASVVAVSTITVNSILYSSKSQIKGLTTSAGLWTSGVLGLTVGAGFYTVALIGFAALLCSLSFFPRLEVYFKNRSNHFEIYLELQSASYLKDFVATIRELGLTIDDIESNPAYANSGLSVYSISVSIHSAELKKSKTHREIIAALSSLEYVNHIEEMR